jgi:hypothetical protein
MFRKKKVFITNEPRILAFMTTTRHLLYADELEDLRMHVLQGFSYLTKGVFIASTIRSAFAYLRKISQVRCAEQITYTL